MNNLDIKTSPAKTRGGGVTQVSMLLPPLIMQRLYWVPVTIIRKLAFHSEPSAPGDQNCDIIDATSWFMTSSVVSTPFRHFVRHSRKFTEPCVVCCCCGSHARACADIANSSPEPEIRPFSHVTKIAPNVEMLLCLPSVILWDNGWYHGQLILVIRLLSRWAGVTFRYP